MRTIIAVDHQFDIYEEQYLEYYWSVPVSEKFKLDTEDVLPIYRTNIYQLFIEDNPNFYPIITIEEYTTELTNQSITEHAQKNKGTINKTSHTFTENGSFEFIATDSYGNVTKEKVTITNINKVAPVISGVSNNETYDKEIIITFDKGIALLNGVRISSNHKVVADGDYHLVVTDEVGNKTEVKFSIKKAPLYVLGDVNGDGRISITDIVMLRRSLAGLITLTETQQKAADLNKDGRVSIADLVQLRRQLAGLQ